MAKKPIAKATKGMKTKKPATIATDINVVLDRSGSMATIADDTIGGFNTFLREQKVLPGAAKMSLYQFDQLYEPIYEGVELAAAPELTRQTFVPRGSTALYDAIGRTIGAVTARGTKDKVVIVITTDGFENASREYTAASLKPIIEAKRAAGWEFVFLGANQDAILTAAAFGISAASAMSTAANAAGTQAMYGATSASLSALRGGFSTSMSYSADDRAQQKAFGAK